MGIFGNIGDGGIRAVHDKPVCTQLSATAGASIQKKNTDLLVNFC